MYATMKGKGMLEFILIVNLAFSVCGFFFIVRMWREVKSRRDFYGENFGIPRGSDMTQQQVDLGGYMNAAKPVMGDVSMEQLVAAVQAATQEKKPAPEPQAQNGDLERLIAAAVAAQNGGA